MVRYIDANDFLKRISFEIDHEIVNNSYNDKDYILFLRALRSLIVFQVWKQDVVDVQEIKHGKWIKVMPRRTGRNATYKCTCCKQLKSSYYNDVQNWEYCPNCGAKMDKE